MHTILESDTSGFIARTTTENVVVRSKYIVNAIQDICHNSAMHNHELDTDHHLCFIPVLSSRLIGRVLSGAVTRWDTSDHQLGKMSYVDFVWFILSEEDKKTNTRFADFDFAIGLRM